MESPAYIPTSAEVAERGREVLGSDEQYTERLDLPIRALGGATPREYLQVGKYEALLDILGRIEKGVFS